MNQINDFKGVFYRVDVWLVPTSEHAGYWTLAGPSGFGIPPGFGSNNPLGSIGTFDEDVAWAGITWLARRFPTRRFRVCRVEVEWSSTPVVWMGRQDPVAVDAMLKELRECLVRAHTEARSAGSCNPQMDEPCPACEGIALLGSPT